MFDWTFSIQKTKPMTQPILVQNLTFRILVKIKGDKIILLERSSRNWMFTVLDYIGDYAPAPKFSPKRTAISTSIEHQTICSKQKTNKNKTLITEEQKY